MRQYTRFKAQHPDCVLFFRMGDFYEMFDDDALLAHRVLGVTLTQRTAGIPMAGVPWHAVEGYLRRMIERGYRVAVCDQVQDAADAVGVIERAVTRVVTPGTLVDEPLLNEGSANVLAAVCFTQSGDHSDALLAAAELSTGRFTLMDLPADRVIDEFARLGPAELVYVETADGVPPPRVAAIKRAVECALTARPAWTFRQRDAVDALKRHFNVATLEGFGLLDADPALAPAGALLRYLQETQAVDGADTAASSSRLAHLRPPTRQSTDQYLVLDAASLRSLEIERTMRTGSTEGSLLSVVQRARTPMGKRLLRQWLCYPLRDASAIRARQEAVSAFVEDAAGAERLCIELDGVLDVARIASRAVMGRASPRDVLALGRSTARIDTIANLLKASDRLVDRGRRYESLAATLVPLAQEIVSRCVDTPPQYVRDGGVIRDGVDAELDEARLLQRDAGTFLAQYQAELVQRTGIPSLKVGYNKVFGYYIEVTNANAERLKQGADDFIRRQTLKNAERYVTPRLKEFEEKVTSAEARALERERLLFEKLVRSITSCAAALAAYADEVAELDVLLAFAHLAVRERWVRPVLVDEPILDIRQGRHPVLDRTLADRFVPNDCTLGAERPGTGDTELDASLEPPARAMGGGFALITGPNMAGKSTFIRQTALIALLAHTGCFVPAQEAVIGLVDRIFTRIGASDELHAGQSTFMVEMTETANILHHATERSLVILDEIGRGTSTLDGLSLAWAIAERLIDTGCRTLFATHYHELTSLADDRAGVINLHVAVREWNDEIIFLHRILPGRTDRSYGIHVAKIAGLPREVVKRASALLDSLAVHTEEGTRSSKGAAPKNNGQLGLFTEYLDHPVVAELRQVDPDSVSPREALELLRKLRERV